MKRRDVLRRSTATVTGLALLSGEALALQTDDQRSVVNTDDHEIPYDLSIHNNSTEEQSIRVTVSPRSSDDSMFTATFSLSGLNSSSVESAAEARLQRRLDISGSGTYDVHVLLPTGESDATAVTVTEDGVLPAEAVTAYVSPSGNVDARTQIR